MATTRATTRRGIVRRLGFAALGLLATPTMAYHHDDPAIATAGPVATFRSKPGSFTMIVSDTTGATLATVVSEGCDRV